MLAWVFKAKRSILFELLFILFRGKKRGARVLFTLWRSTDKWSPLSSRDCQGAKFPYSLTVPISCSDNLPFGQFCLSFATRDYHRWMFRLKRSTSYQCSGKKNAAINKLFKKHLLFSLPIWQFKLWDEFCSVHCRCKMCENKVLSKHNSFPLGLEKEVFLTLIVRENDTCRNWG